MDSTNENMNDSEQNIRQPIHDKIITLRYDRTNENDIYADTQITP